MAYQGNKPAEAFSSFQKQDFSTSATTSYTLDHPVSNQNEIALFINFVRQEPTAAYTASGTTLTLTSATASTDDMYCVYLGQAKQTVNAPDGSVGSSQVAASIITGQTAETSIATDDTVLIHDTSAGALRKMTRANFVSGIGGTNTPAFAANLGSHQTISNNTTTTVSISTELFDVGGCFNHTSSSTTLNGLTAPAYSFTPNESGKYLIGIKSLMSTNGNHYNISYIVKNTTNMMEMQNQDEQGARRSQFASVIVELNGTGDYVKMQMYQNSGSSQTLYAGDEHTQMFGYKIIE